MSKIDTRFSIDESFERIEETILPGIAAMLESIVDPSARTASLGTYSTTLRQLAEQVEAMTRQVESCLPPQANEPDSPA